jgi:hypothetical protein
MEIALSHILEKRDSDSDNGARKTDDTSSQVGSTQATSLSLMPTHAQGSHGVSFAVTLARARANSPGVCLPPSLFLNVHKIRVDSDNKR